MSIGPMKSGAQLTVDGPTKVSFILLDRFSMLSFSATLEILKIANDVIGHAAYEWEIIGVSGADVASRNGVAIAADRVLSGTGTKTRSFDRSDIVFLFPGPDVEGVNDRHVAATLRRAIRDGARIVAYDTGAFWLANAGLLSGRACTIHWEALPAFEEKFGLQTQVSRDIFVVDGAITTCAGACSAVDLGLHLVASHHGDDVAKRVSEIVLVDRQRGSNERQRLPLQAQWSKADTRFVRAIELMIDSHDGAVSISRIADAVSLSRRQLERMFRSETGLSPSRYHLILRMERAHLLLCRSSMQILEIAASCGFVSSSHFSKTYKSLYGVPPNQTRATAQMSASDSSGLLNRAFHHSDGICSVRSLPVQTPNIQNKFYAMAS